MNIERAYGGPERVVRSLYRGGSLAVLGDSILNRAGPLFQASGASYHLGDSIASGDKIFHGYNGFFSIANMLLGWPFDIVSNAAYSGITAAETLARIPIYVAPYRPKFTAVLTGINDILSGRSADSVISTYKQIIAALQRIDSTPILFSPFPNGDVTTAQKLELMKLVQWLRDCEQRYADTIFGGDLFHACGDPDTGGFLASGSYGALGNLSTDDTHPNEYGAGIAATEVYNRLSPIFKPCSTLTTGGTTAAATGQWDLLYNATNGTNVRGNFIANGKMLGTAGTVGAVASGSLADGWSVVNATNPGGSPSSILLSKVANNGIVDRGSWQQISIDGADNAGILSIRREAITRTDSGGGSTAWAVGDDVYAQCRMETDASNWGGAAGALGTVMSLEIQGTDASASELWRSQCFQQQSPGSAMLFRPASSTAMVMRTPVVRIPAGTVRLFLWLYFRGIGTIRFTDVEMRKRIAL